MGNSVTKQDIAAQGKATPPMGFAMNRNASEATAIEQARAIAQVQGALIVARNNPRDPFLAYGRMREACAIQALAERAFFRYSRGGSQITGPSIHLAAEIGRCWGNVDFGVQELRRDDMKGESEMQTFAWDLETNVRVFNTFIVPHKRDKKARPGEARQPEMLTDLRDIYENNANNAARRLRECIFRILPVAYVEEAKEICAKTLEDGGDIPIQKRREILLQAFADLGVTRAQVEKKVGRSADQLTALDLGTMRVVYGSLRRGETAKEDEFPEDAAADTTAALKAKAADSTEKQPEPKAEPETTSQETGNTFPGDLPLKGGQ